MIKPTKPFARVLLTHVGTSLLDCDAMMTSGNADFGDWRERLKRGEGLTGDRRDKLIAAWGDALATRLATIWQGHGQEDRKREKAPAEIASLQLLKAQHNERVVLICSGTPDGLLCGQVLERCLSSTIANGFIPAGVQLGGTFSLPGVDVRPQTTQKTFVEDGLPAYMQLVAREYKELAARWCPENPSPVAFNRLIFNVTGGYKGTIPFATLAAQVLNAYPQNVEHGIRAEVAYAHRESADAVSLTPDLPLAWDGEMSIRARYEEIKARNGSERMPTAPFERAILELLDALNL